MKEGWELAEKILKAVGEPLLILDANLKIIQANTSFRRTFHLLAKDIDGQVIFNLKNGQWDIPKLRELLEKVITNNNIADRLELSHNFSDTGYKHLMINAHQIGGKGDGSRTVLLHIQDITEQKKAKEVLARYESAFHEMSDIIPVVLWKVTADANQIAYVSPAYKRVFGDSTQSMFKGPRPWLDVIHPEDRERIINLLQKHPVKKGYVEYRIIRPNESIRWMHDRSFGIQNEQGQTTYIMGFVEDVTERKKTEEALQKSEEFSSSLLVYSPNPILVINPDSSIRYVNSALERLTGFSAKALIGKRPPFPWWTEQNYKELSLNHMRFIPHRARRREFLFKKKNGEQFWIESIFKTVKVAGEFQYCLIYWTDITERKRLRDNMEFYISQITRAQEEERKRIAREIHDDVIQSLASLVLEIDAITRGKNQTKENMVERLKDLRSKTKAIVEDLRHVSHELRPGTIDQVGLTPALETLTEDVRKETPLRIRLEVTGNERRLAPETEMVLFRIAQEALRNIKKHSEATEAIVRLKFAPAKVKLTISDNGKGFKVPETLGDFVAKRKLGLIGMQERARLLDSKFRVKSWLGRGTTIRVEVRTAEPGKESLNNNHKPLHHKINNNK